MRVAARKTPAREDVPQYSIAAVFEAVVNAVAHSDYSVAARRIRLSMFKNRLEIDSPGQLPNGMTIEAMNASQATRNEVIASVFGRIPVGEVPGSNHRQHLMERRGDGVSIILKKTEETAGFPAAYKVVDGSSLVLSIPAAKTELVPATGAVTVHSAGDPLPGADVLALFPNKTWQRANTDEGRSPSDPPNRGQNARRTDGTGSFKKSESAPTNALLPPRFRACKTVDSPGRSMSSGADNAMGRARMFR
ncbi:MAG: hypothetical protein OXI87_21275 [Albidovulum sp.]|nr:hypothetical protein [Albidovulum sp.]MDE0307386.1 hypothetical protein [Albidovulum sp.]